MNNNRVGFSKEMMELKHNGIKKKKDKIQQPKILCTAKIKAQ